MSNQEQAFHDWYDNQPTFGVDYQEIWTAACTWQREQDALICRDQMFDEDGEWINDTEKSINSYLDFCAVQILYGK